MNKTEFLKIEKGRFDSLDKDNAIRLVKLFNTQAREYFSLWQDARRENEILKIAIIDSDHNYDWVEHDKKVKELKILESGTE